MNRGGFDRIKTMTTAKVNRHIFQEGERFDPIIFTDTSTILMLNNIFDPMEAIFNGLMPSNAFSKDRSHIGTDHY